MENNIIKLNFKLKADKELAQLENITVKANNDNYNVYVNEENIGTLFADHKKKFNVELLDKQLEIKEFILHESISRKTGEKYNWIECYYLL